MADKLPLEPHKIKRLEALNDELRNARQKLFNQAAKAAAYNEQHKLDMKELQAEYEAAKRNLENAKRTYRISGHEVPDYRGQAGFVVMSLDSNGS